MQRIDGELVLSPTDLTKHLACPHITTLDRRVASGEIPAPALEDDALALVFRKGMEHERAYLASLRAQGRSVVEIASPDPGAAGRRDAESATLDAMCQGVDVVYQATFYDGSWSGQADFLIRVDRASDLGDWSYEIADTKLARRLKVAALVQMAVYADRLTSLQGRAPDHVHVVTGDGVSRSWRLADVAHVTARARARLRAAVDGGAPTEPVPCRHCVQCRWQPRCRREWEDGDDVGSIAFLRADQRQALRDAGITTVAELAGRTADDLPPSIGAASRARLARQARLQVAEREQGRPCWELSDPEPGRGLLRLPAPSHGDTYLDFEGDPYAEGGEGREYLAGLWSRDGSFTSMWAHSRAHERVLTERLVDELLARWRADAGMHVYHYAPYEVTALQRLTMRHGTREAELDQLLRGERFVDLYGVVRQGLGISKPSYSLKKMEAFYWGETRTGAEDEVADAMSSVIAYEEWLAERGDAAEHVHGGADDVLRRIEAYNRDDVRSTHDLHTWLEERRTDLEARHGPLPRPEPPDADAHAELGLEEAAEVALAQTLRDGGLPLLAGLVSWHRREARPRWWDVFRLRALTESELVLDGAALGDLSEPQFVRDDKRSRVYRYTFPPQDTKVRAGQRALDAATTDSAGEVLELDPVAGVLLLKVGRARPAPQVRGLGPPGPPGDEVIRRSIAATARAVLAGQFPPGAALVARAVPDGTALRPGERAADALRRVGMRLGTSPGAGPVLAVQGPPGTGKTYQGARLIRALLDDGCTVGVTAQSHAVIAHLLEAVDRPALQRCGEREASPGGKVQRAAQNADVAEALGSGRARLVGGTAWLWSREELAAAVDVLVVDEAGQFPLANAVAVSRATRALVLLGDPQQLAQPSQAHHPDGAGASALEHLLGDHDTLPPERGVFLDVTHRMHPAICGFVSRVSYDDRLEPLAGLERQRVDAPGALTGTGLRWLPVDHSGNVASSQQEVETVAKLFPDLLAGHWTDADGARRPMTVDDVLVVAPYNSHVARLRAALPDGARVGTVDLFQGRQAPVVIYSMASSSAEDAPRGVDFLYDLHRLTVAVSRAQALVVLVASPRLLDALAGTPEQLRLVNALCAYQAEATTLV